MVIFQRTELVINYVLLVEIFNNTMLQIQRLKNLLWHINFVLIVVMEQYDKYLIIILMEFRLKFIGYK